jgi:hypothetical protein
MRVTTALAATITVGGLLAAASPTNAAAYTFTQLDVPGANFTQAFGINDAGQIVGFFFSNTGEHGFLATAIPEPATLTLLSVGLAITGLGMMRRRATSPKPH